MNKLKKYLENLCPKKVEYKQLRDICSIEKGRQLNKELLLSTGKYPVVNGGIDFSGYWNEYNFEENLITISQGGASAGHVNFLKTKFWAGAHCYVVKTKNEINSKYLYHFLKQKEKYLKKSQVGAGIPSLSLKEIYSLQIPLPSIEMQKEIAQFLDKFMDLISKMNEELIAQKKLYNYYQNQLIKNCDGKSYKLNEFCKIFDGTHETPNYQSKGINFISVENISNIYESNKHISLKDYQKYKIKPQINDVFMTRMGTIGKCAVVEKSIDLAYYVSLALLKPNNNIINSKYLKYYIESKIGQEELARRTLIHAVPIKINKDDIGKIKIIVPPMETQQKIVDVLDKFEKLNKTLHEEIELRKKQYEYYCDKLLNFKEV